MWAWGNNSGTGWSDGAGMVARGRRGEISTSVTHGPGRRGPCMCACHNCLSPAHSRRGIGWEGLSIIRAHEHLQWAIMRLKMSERVSYRTLSIFVSLEHRSSHKYICSNSQQYIVWHKIINFNFMPKIVRILRSCFMTIICEFPTVNIFKIKFWTKYQFHKTDPYDWFCGHI